MRHTIKKTICEMRHTIYDRKGFTLIEVLAAIILIAAALIPIMIITTQIIEKSLKDEELTKVIFLAEGKIEDVKRGVVDSFATSATESTTAFDSPNDDYKYTVSDDGAASIKVIQGCVWYGENNDDTSGPGESNITLSTKVADRG